MRTQEISKIRRNILKGIAVGIPSIALSGCVPSGISEKLVQRGEQELFNKVLPSITKLYRVKGENAEKASGWVLSREEETITFLTAKHLVQEQEKDKPYDIFSIYDVFNQEIYNFAPDELTIKPDPDPLRDLASITITSPQIRDTSFIPAVTNHTWKPRAHQTLYGLTFESLPPTPTLRRFTVSELIYTETGESANSHGDFHLTTPAKEGMSGGILVTPEGQAVGCISASLGSLLARAVHINRDISKVK